MIILIAHTFAYMSNLYSLDILREQRSKDGHSRVCIRFLVRIMQNRLKGNIMRFFIDILIKWFLQCKFSKLKFEDENK